MESNRWGNFSVSLILAELVQTNSEMFESIARSSRRQVDGSGRLDFSEWKLECPRCTTSESWSQPKSNSKWFIAETIHTIAILKSLTFENMLSNYCEEKITSELVCPNICRLGHKYFNIQESHRVSIFSGCQQRQWGKFLRNQQAAWIIAVKLVGDLPKKITLFVFRYVRRVCWNSDETMWWSVIKVPLRRLLQFFWTH